MWYVGIGDKIWVLHHVFIEFNLFWFIYIYIYVCTYVDNDRIYEFFL